MKFITSIFILTIPQTSALNNAIPLSFKLPNIFNTATKTKVTSSNANLEDQLLEAIETNGKDNRLNNSQKISSIVEQLEQSSKSIPNPAIAPEVYGKWRLLHTTNANTSSPIQRKAVDSTKFNIYQDILLNENEQTLIVSQVVKFGPKSELKVDALASTSAYPLAELTERKGSGKILGINILGVSAVGTDAQPDPTRPNSRINFVFDEGEFDLQGLKLPYPVPFRSPFFRDAVKGWIDITYLSNRIRISRGNKGTTFVLLKED